MNEVSGQQEEAGLIVKLHCLDGEEFKQYAKEAADVGIDYIGGTIQNHRHGQLTAFERL